MVYRTRIAGFAALALGILIVLGSAIAQTLPKSPQGGDNEAGMREHKNLWTVGLVGGLFEGTFMRFAEEIRKVLDDGDEMRVSVREPEPEKVGAAAAPSGDEPLSEE